MNGSKQKLATKSPCLPVGMCSSHAVHMEFQLLQLSGRKTVKIYRLVEIDWKLGTQQPLTRGILLVRRLTELGGSATPASSKLLVSQNKNYLVNKLAFLKGPNFFDISWHTNAKNVLELHSDGVRFAASVVRSYAPINSRLWSFEDWIGKFPPPRTKMVFICPTPSSDFSVKCSS